MALFSDDVLYQEILSKATFWLQQSFYGVNLSPLHTDALDQYFTQVHHHLHHFLPFLIHFCLEFHYSYL